MKKAEKTREELITQTSILGIIVNVFIAALKIVLGIITSSMAIVSEGVNNATDALSSVLTLVGTKLAQKHPDEKHPFGYGRIEYITGLVVSTIIIVSGVEMLRSSIELIMHPEELTVSYISIAIIIISAVVKFLHGTYTIKIGRKTGSSALEAVGLEGRNDSFSSAITLVSIVLFVLFGFSLDAYAALIISGLILKAGLETLWETISEIIGRPGEEELASTLYKEIRATDGVIAAADMMLHNYGPDAWSGSVNIEIDHKKTVGEVYQIIHALQLKIMHEYKVTMVFGIYAVDYDHEEANILRKQIGKFISTNEHVKSYHAVYLEPETKKIYCDFIVDYSLQDWDSLRFSFEDYMNKLYPESEIELTIETEFV